MRQNPDNLINDIHERVADDGSDQMILSDYTEDPTIWGFDLKWLVVMMLPAMVMFRVAVSYLTGATQLYGMAAAVVLAGIAGLVAVAAPDDVKVRDYLETVIGKYAYQQEMIHDRNPDSDERQLEQPKNDSLLGRVARSPLVRDWPIIGAGDYEPTQALIPHEKPIRGEYAIKLEDGSFIAGIGLQSIPLRLAAKDTRKKVERAVANALEGTVDYHVQWFSPTRVADFEHRRSQWEERARGYQSAADRLASTDGEQAASKAIRKQILADIADERAAGINLTEQTNRITEHYLIVSVDPDAAVIDSSSETGGIDSVPGIRWFVKQYRLWQESGSDEHEAALIRKLKRRTDDLARELNRIDDLTPTALPAAEFSEVIADHYRGQNVRAHDNFTDAIRGSPVPGSASAADPEHDAGYDHITNRDRAGSPPTSSPSGSTIHATADGGAVSGDAAAEARETNDSEPSTSNQHPEPEEETNE